MAKKDCRRDVCKRDCIRGFDVCPQRIGNAAASVCGWLLWVSVISSLGYLFWKILDACFPFAWEH